MAGRADDGHFYYLLNAFFVGEEERKGGLSMFIDNDLRDRLTCERAKDLTPGEFYDLIIRAVTPAMPYLAHAGMPPIEIIPLLDYGMSASDARWGKLSEIKNIDNWLLIHAAPQPGGSEGVYVGVSLDTYDPFESSRVITETPLFVFKTLSEGPDAYAAMGALAGMISYAVELFLIMNF